MRTPSTLRAAIAGLLLIPPIYGQQPEPTFPGEKWESVKPEAVFMSSQRLEILRAWLKTHKTTAMMLVVGGRVAFEYGDVTRVSKVASIRKSILAMMFGRYVASGQVDLNQTVKEIGLDDVTPFLPREERATLLQLMMARSGIYLDAGNGELGSLSPRRGSQEPGTYYQYQNWDFNAVGTAFEKLTGQDIYAALEKDLAKPIGMQDFDIQRQHRISVMPESVHPEYAMYLSTRDMARLGVLMSRDGVWNGKRILPEGWVKRITTLVTHPNEIHPLGAGGQGLPGTMDRWGYGMLWWVWDAPSWPGVVTSPFQGAYTAMGAYGQYITVLPAFDAVVVHKVYIDEPDEDPNFQVRPEEYTAILAMLAAAGCAGVCE